jgi:hypothetical protein
MPFQMSMCRVLKCRRADQYHLDRNASHHRFQRALLIRACVLRRRIDLKQSDGLCLWYSFA